LVSDWGRERFFVGVWPKGLRHCCPSSVTEELEVIFDELWHENSLAVALFGLLRFCIAYSASLVGSFLFLLKIISFGRRAATLLNCC